MAAAERRAAAAECRAAEVEARAARRAAVELESARGEHAAAMAATRAAEELEEQVTMRTAAQISLPPQTRPLSTNPDGDARCGRAHAQL